MTDWYTKTGAPSTGSQGSSATMRNEFSAIESDISNKLPTLTGNGAEVVVVNSGGTALETTPQLSVAQGGTGAATLTDGGILLGSGTGAITAMSVLADGQIVIGDGTTDPTTLSAFTSSTGQLKHEYGGLEANISGVVDGDFIVGTGTGTVGLESGATVRSTMGLGSIATQNSNAVSITGGSATGLTDLSTTNFSIGGTAVTATAIELNYTDVTTAGTAQASKAAVLDSNASIRGLYKASSSGLIASNLDAEGYGLRVKRSSTGSIAIIQFTNNGETTEYALIYADGSNDLIVHNSTSGRHIDLTTTGGGIVKINGNTAWNAGNDGSGSGLDADLLDGINSTSFARVDAATNFTTAPTINSNTIWNAGNYPYSAESGYTHIGGGTYRVSGAISSTTLVLNALTAIAAPTNALGIILRIEVLAASTNAVDFREGNVYTYSDAGTTLTGAINVGVREFVATSAGTPLAKVSTEVFLPVVSGNSYVKWTAGYEASYAIVGYTR